MNRTIVRYSLILIATFGSVTALAQETGTEVLEDEQLVKARALLQAGRADIIREDLRMSDEEAKGFWPVYENYRADIMEVRDRQGRMIADFLKKYRAGELTNEYAEWLIEEHFAFKNGLLKVQKKHLRRFRKVLPALKVARFYQLENKMDAETDAQLALFVPLVEAL
jgi:hypothetical protein